jgi:regulator of protease activity HflC (stomatin/prohibitin superfamily)
MDAADGAPAPIQAQGIITRDNVRMDVSAVACYRVVDAITIIQPDGAAAR